MTDSRVISLADIPIIIIKLALVDCSDTHDLETWRLRLGSSLATNETDTLCLRNVVIPHRNISCKC